jgi:hypothetical protein
MNAMRRMSPNVGWMRRLSAVTIAVAATALAVASPALAADVATPFDGIDQATVNDLDAAGNEIPFSTASTVIRSVMYDSSAFTTSNDEIDVVNDGINTNRTGCQRLNGNFDFGGRTGWTRFLAAASGRLSVDVSSGYDSMSHAYGGPASPFSLHAVGTPNLTADYDCTNAIAGPGTEHLLFSRQIPAGQPIFIQTLGVCAANTTVKCAAPDAAPGGSTTVTFTFVPDNVDGDAVPDPIDQCRDTPGNGPDGCPDADNDGISDHNDACQTIPGVAPDGCPVDLDGDGIANASDACPFVVGVAPNGCPADPDPDRDGVVAALDKCPAQAGTAADGCPDTDADGVSDRVDACPKVKGDKANGCPSEIGATFPDQWLFVGRRTKVGTLAVRAPVGARIELRCAGTKRSCAFKVKTIKKTKKARTNLVPLFGRKRILDAGTLVTVRVTVAGRIGSYERLTMRAGRLPKVSRGCISLAGKSVRCG